MYLLLIRYLFHNTSIYYSDKESLPEDRLSKTSGAKESLYKERSLISITPKKSSKCRKIYYPGPLLEETPAMVQNYSELEDPR